MRVRWSVLVVLVAVAVLVPVGAGADSDGTASDAVAATAQCATEGFSYVASSGECEDEQSQPANAVCPATIGGVAVVVSGINCVTAARDV